MISRAPRRATSSITSPSSRSPPNRASISARIFSVGGRGRARARFRDLSRPVSLTRPPHPPCASPRNGRSTGSRGLRGGGGLRATRPWCRDVRPAPAVAHCLYLRGAEHRFPALSRDSSRRAGEEPPVESLPGDPFVPLAQPPGDTAPDAYRSSWDRREPDLVSRCPGRRESQQALPFARDSVTVTPADGLEHVDTQRCRIPGPGDPPYAEDEAVDEHRAGEDAVPGK